jgi:hypothetical protein
LFFPDSKGHHSTIQNKDKRKLILLKPSKKLSGLREIWSAALQSVPCNLFGILSLTSKHKAEGKCTFNLRY